MRQDIFLLGRHVGRPLRDMYGICTIFQSVC